MNNASTREDVTNYFAVVPSNHLERLLWAEAERMSNLDVNEANFKSERAVVQEEYRERVLANPYGRFYEAIAPRSYAVHPYRRGVIGNIAELDAASLDDVRAFHRTYYRPDNAILIVTGDFDPKELDAWIDKYFGAHPAAVDADSARRRGGARRARRTRAIAMTGPNVPLPAVAIDLARTVRAQSGRGGAARRGRAARQRRVVAPQPGAGLPRPDRAEGVVRRRHCAWTRACSSPTRSPPRARRPMTLVEALRAEIERLAQKPMPGEPSLPR